MKKHTDDKPYNCDQCDKKFRNECVLEDHVKGPVISYVQLIKLTSNLFYLDTD